MTFVVRSLAFAVVLTALAPAALGQRWFPTPRTFAPGGNAVAVGDVDQDNDPDVLFVQGSNLILRRNDGAADFTADVPIPLPSGVNLQHDVPLLVDVDGDLTLDLVLPGTTGIVILPGDGSGGFGPAASVALPAPGNQIAAGDFNQDGVSDVVVASGSNPVEVRWVFWNGVQFQRTLPAVMPSLLAAGALAAGDIDSDGDDDAVMSGGSSGTFETVLTVGGFPTYGHQSFVVGTLGFDTIDLAVGDLDNDGDDDVLGVNAKNDDVTMQVFDNQAGTLVSAPAVTHTQNNLGTTFAGEAFRVADWDQDGDLDVMSQITISFFDLGRLAAVFFENTGASTFAFPTLVPVPAIGRMAGTADFDGDGHVDFCGTASIVFGDSTFDEQFPIDTPSWPATEYRRDFEGDGDVDYLITDLLLRNDATGTFTDEGQLLPDPGPNFFYQGPVAFGDFTGDGRDDFLVELWIPVGDIFTPDVFVEMRVVAATPDGAFVDVGTGAAPPGVLFGGTGSRAADFDVDGDVDVFTPGGLWTNDGTGFFSIVQPVAFTSIQDAADVDQDGDLDLLVRVADDLFLLRRDQGTSYYVELVLTQAGQTPDARLLDLDGDQDRDVVVPSVETSTFGDTIKLSLVEQLANGSFAAPVVLDPLGTRTEAFGIDDMDGDGVVDLLAASVSFDGAHWSLQPHGTILGYRRTGPGLTYEPARRWLGHRTGDFTDVDADGDVDAVGRTMVRNTRFSSPTQGRIRQYGEGTPGSGGAVPTLGAQGPATTSSTSFEVRVRDAVGGATSVFLVGVLEASIADFPFAGMTLLVGGSPLLVTLPLGGTPGAAGEGTLTVPVTLPSTTAGKTVFVQVWHVDTGAPNWLNQSNGLELTFGS